MTLICSDQIGCFILSWCGYGDSNPNAVKHENLNLACLPIPSYPHIKLFKICKWRKLLLNSST